MSQSNDHPQSSVPGVEPETLAAGWTSFAREEELRLLRAAIDTTAEAVFFIDRASLLVLDANRAARDAWGVLPGDGIAPIAGVPLDGWTEALDAAIRRQPECVEIPVISRKPVRNAGRAVWRMRAAPTRRGPVVIVAARPLPAKPEEDDAEVRPGVEDSRHAGGNDPLTGLPDRRRFEERLARALADRRHRPDRPFAVLFVDLDGFKAINDRLGHLCGDRVLREIARRLASCVRPGDLVSRFGGDEFTVFLDQVGSQSDATRVAQRIREHLQQPIEIEGESLSVTASVGIAMSGPRYQRPEQMLHDADRAMYEAKRNRA